MTQKQKQNRVTAGAGLATAGSGAGAWGIDRYRNQPMHYRFYLGGNEGVTAKPISEARIAAFRRRVLNRHLPGYTVVPAKGFWTEAGKEVSEPTNVLSYIGKRKEQGALRDVAASYGRVFKQSSVLMTREPVAARFLQPGKSQTLRALVRILGRAK